jgi:hypothetical protein
VKRPLRIPLALSVVMMTGVTAATTIHCGDDAAPTADASTNCTVFCVYEQTDNGNCPFPTCATGPQLDQCPSGCIPEPIA